MGKKHYVGIGLLVFVLTLCFTARAQSAMTYESTKYVKEMIKKTAQNLSEAEQSIKDCDDGISKSEGNIALSGMDKDVSDVDSGASVFREARAKFIESQKKYRAAVSGYQAALSTFQKALNYDNADIGNKALSLFKNSTSDHDAAGTLYNEGSRLFKIGRKKHDVQFGLMFAKTDLLLCEVTKKMTGWARDSYTTGVNNSDALYGMFSLSEFSGARTLYENAVKKTRDADKIIDEACESYKSALQQRDKDRIEAFKKSGKDKEARHKEISDAAEASSKAAAKQFGEGLDKILQSEKSKKKLAVFLQEKFRGVCIDPGKVSGAISPATEEAVKTFKVDAELQKENEADSRISVDLIMKMNPDSFSKDLLVKRGDACLNLLDHARAITFYTKAVGMDNKDSSLLTKLGIAYRIKKDPAAALEKINAALQYDANNVDAYWHRGGIYLDKENYDAAIRDFLKVNKAAPDFPDAYGLLGWTLILKGKFIEARTPCQKAYDLNSASYANTVNLGHTYLLAGDSDKARDYYKKTLPLIKTDDEFTKGPVTDFAIFIKNGWQVKESKKQLAWMKAEWGKLKKKAPKKKKSA